MVSQDVMDAPPSIVDQVSGVGLDVQIANDLIEKARQQGVSLVGEGSLLAGITKTVLQTALDAEMVEHLGYDKGEAPEGIANHRNGTSPKTVKTEVGPICIDVPRDRAGTFQPQIVPKHARRVAGFDEAIISLYAKGLTTGEIQAHLAQIYDVDVSRELISKITDKVADELVSWQSRPLDRVYPVVFIDALVVKIRDGQVANRPVYVAVGVNLDGERDVLGLWVGTGGEGAKHWMATLAELKNRGIDDVCILCCDGLKGLPEAVAAIWPLATVQTYTVHLVRASLRYASKKHWEQISKQLRVIYTACTVDAAGDAFEEFEQEWKQRYPAVINLWRAAWQEFIPFLQFPPEVRKVIYTTNMIESLNARFRQATRRRGHFPNEQAALKVLYLVIRDKTHNRPHVTGKISGWKTALNTLAVLYGERIIGN